MYWPLSPPPPGDSSDDKPPHFVPKDHTPPKRCPVCKRRITLVTCDPFALFCENREENDENKRSGDS